MQRALLRRQRRRHVRNLFSAKTPPTSYAEVMQCDKAAFNRFFHAMLAEGVLPRAIGVRRPALVSSAHGETEIERDAQRRKQDIPGNTRQLARRPDGS